jgi:hypothetical protein
VLSRRYERAEAASELAQIPFICGLCGWEGWGDDLEGSRDDRDPNHWELCCPRCGPEEIELTYCACTECGWEGWVNEEEEERTIDSLLEREDLAKKEEALLDALLERDSEVALRDCPKCGRASLHRTIDRESVTAQPEPDLRDLSLKKVITRWQALGRPKLEHPNYHWMFKDTPIADLESGAAKADLMPNEVSYIAQQLWPSLSTTLANISDRSRNWRPFAEPRANWGQELVAQRGAAIWALVGLVVLGLLVWLNVR